MPKAEETNKTISNRLFSIEDAVFEYGKIRDKNLEGAGESGPPITLWEVYGDKEIYYNRCPNNNKKQQFGHIFMNVAGINL